MAQAMQMRARENGPLKKCDMEDDMTMVFRAGDPAMLKAVKPGDRLPVRAGPRQRPVHGDEDRKGKITGDKR